MRTLQRTATQRVLTLAVCSLLLTTSSRLFAEASADQADSATRQVDRKRVAAERHILHRASINKEGVLSGKLQVAKYGENASDADEVEPAADAEVMLLQSRSMVHQVTTDQRGRFEMADVVPGIYTMVASSPDGFLTMTVSVDEASVKRGSVRAFLVPTADVKYAETMLAEYLPANLTLPAFLPLKRMGVEAGQSDKESQPMREIATDDPTDAAKTQQPDRVRRLAGRMLDYSTATGEAVPASQLNVKLVRDGRPASSLELDAAGIFSTRTPRKHYSILAVGTGGLLFTGIEIDDRQSAEKKPQPANPKPADPNQVSAIDGEIIIEGETIIHDPILGNPAMAPIAESGAWGVGHPCAVDPCNECVVDTCIEIECAIVPVEEVFLKEELVEEFPLEEEAPLAAGGFGGGGGGIAGGGGGLGGGGLGALLGAAALGLGVAALLDDDDDDDLRVATPFTPTTGGGGDGDDGDG